MSFDVVKKGAARPGFTSLVLGLVLLGQLAFTRVIARFYDGQVSLFGHPIHWDCWFRQRFGVPCPACGMTRSVILTLSGHFFKAAEMNVAGLLGVLGLTAFGFAMVFLFFVQKGGSSRRTSAWEMQIRFWTVAYGSATVLIWAAQWFLRISGHAAGPGS
jgi:hypothetical protein